MNNINIIINMIIGISIMLFGMNMMSDSIRNLADNKLELYLYKLTDNKPKAILFGFISTAIVQSSAAISSIAVSFLDSSLIKLKQAGEIILGAIIGTSATGFIIAFSSIGANGIEIESLLSAKTLIAIFCITGIIFKLIFKNNRYNKIGDIVLGFALIMFGITTISAESSVLKESYFVKNIVFESSNLFIALFSGIIISSIFQSASAAVGLIQSFGAAGIISLSFSIPYLSGVMIGSSLPVLIFAAGKSNKAKKGAITYLLYNLIGSILIIVLYLFIKDRINIFLNSFQIAVLNFLIRFITLIVIYPFSEIIEKIINEIKIKAKNPKREESQQFNQQ